MQTSAVYLLCAALLSQGAIAFDDVALVQRSVRAHDEPSAPAEPTSDTFEVQLNQLLMGGLEHPDVKKRMMKDLFAPMKQKAQEYMANRPLSTKEIAKIPGRIEQLHTRIEELSTEKKTVAEDIKEMTLHREEADTKEKKKAFGLKLGALRKRQEELSSQSEWVAQQTQTLEQLRNEIRSKDMAVAKELDEARRAEWKEEMEIQAKWDRERREKNEQSKEDAMMRPMIGMENRKLAEHDRAARQLKAKFDRKNEEEFRQWKAEKAVKDYNKEEVDRTERQARAWAQRRVKEQAEKSHGESLKISRELAQEHRVMSEAEPELATDDKRMKHVFFEEMMGEVSTATMVELFQSLREAAASEAFMHSVQWSFEMVQKLASTYMMVANNNIANFVDANGKAETAKDLTQVMANFMNQSAEGFAEHADGLQKVLEVVQSLIPARMNKSVSKFVEKLTPPVTSLHLDADSMKKGMSRAAACEAMSGVMGNISVYKNLGGVREMINATTKMLPSLSKLMPDLTPEVSALVSNLVQIGYIETGALQEVSRKIIKEVGPVVTKDLGCTWSAAGPRMGVGLLVAAAAMVMSFLRL